MGPLERSRMSPLRHPAFWCSRDSDRRRLTPNGGARILGVGLEAAYRYDCRPWRAAPSGGGNFGYIKHPVRARREEARRH